MKNKWRNRAGLMGLVIAAIVLLAISAIAGEAAPSKRVIIMWDTSQSMVKRRVGRMATDSDLKRLDGYLHTILFRGIPESEELAGGDWIEWEPGQTKSKTPLIDSNCLVTAYRFAEELEPQRVIAQGGDPDLATRLRQFFPAPRWQDSRYIHMNTAFARAIVDAHNDPAAQARLAGQPAEMYLIVISDNKLEQGPDGSLPNGYPNQYLRIQRNLALRCTLGVKCSPERVDMSHTIMISIQGPPPPPIEKVTTVVVTTTQAVPVITEAPTSPIVEQPEPVPPPAMYDLACSASGPLAIRMKGGRFVSTPFDVAVKGDPQRPVPAPEIAIEFLGIDGDVLTTGVVDFGAAASLPSRGRLVSSAYRGSIEPRSARFRLPAKSVTGAQAIDPAQLDVAFKRGGAGGLIFLLLFAALVVAAVIVWKRYFAPPKEVLVTLVLDPDKPTEERKAMPPMDRRDELVLGRPFKEEPWFTGVNCAPWKINYRPSAFKGELHVRSIAARIEDAEGESADSGAYILAVPRGNEPATQDITLHRADGRPQTWELRIEVVPVQAQPAPADARNADFPKRAGNNVPPAAGR